MSSVARFVGVDAGRDVIEASVRPTGEIWTVHAGEEGMTQIADRLSHIHPQLVVMQAKGTFELPLAGILLTVGLPVALVQPRNVREFARAIGRLSRTEQGRSGLLAQFAELVQPEACPLPDGMVEQLKQLRARRTEIVQMIALERSRCDSASPAVEKDVQSHVQYLERSLSDMEGQFSRQIRMSRAWH